MAPGSAAMTNNGGNASPAHSETTGTTWCEDEHEQKKQHQQKHKKPKKDKKNRSNSNNSNSSKDNQEREKIAYHDGICAAGCGNDHYEPCTECTEHNECRKQELAYCEDCIGQHDVPTAQLHDDTENQHNDDDNSTILTGEERNKNGNNVTNSKNRNGYSLVADGKGQCSSCNKILHIRNDGNLRVHNCVGNQKSQANDEGTNNEAARERGRAAATSMRQQNGHPRLEDRQQLLIEDQNRMLQHGEFNTPTQQQEQQQPAVLSRQARKRRLNDKLWGVRHMELLALAAEPGIDRAQFTEILGLIMEHTPPGVQKLPIIDNSHKITGRNADDNVGHEDDDEENEAIRREQMVEGRAEIATTANTANDKTMIKLIHIHMANGNMSKARQVLGSKGLFDTTTTEGIDMLKSKYPTNDERLRQGTLYQNSDENVRSKDLPVHSGGMDMEASKEALLTFITSKRWGASPGVSGHSNDNYKQLLLEHPRAVEHLAVIADRIAGGSLHDGGERESLVMGKGTALRKKGKDVRPITTLTPIYNQCGHVTTKYANDEIEAACGPIQLGMKSGGIEANGHGIDHALQSDYTLVALVYDSLNAFHNCDQQLMLEDIEQYVPKMAKFAKMQFDMTPAKTVYHDRKSDTTLALEMTKGVPQGGTASAAQYCVSQSVRILTPLLQQYGDRIRASSAISDNMTIVAKPRDAHAIRKTIKALQKQGMDGDSRADKCTVYGYGDYPPEERALFEEDDDDDDGQKVRWIEKEDGFMCAGTPIGSLAYKTKQVEDKADEIIAELDKIHQIAMSEHSGMGNTVQTFSSMIRMCTAGQFMFLLRVLPPSVTIRAAERIDRKVANTIYGITRTTKLLPEENSEDMKTQLNRLFTPIAQGGDGFTSLWHAAQGAYVGSILLSASLMSQISSDVGEMMENREMTQNLAEFAAIIEELKAEGIEAVRDIDPHSRDMWSKSSKGMQKKINMERAKKRAEALRSAIPPLVQQPPGSPIDHNDVGMRHQLMANTNKEASAWMLANPGIANCKIPDAEYCTAFWIRNGLNALGSRRFCICGGLTATNGDHTNACPLMKVRGQRMDMHTTLANVLRSSMHGATGSGKYHVPKGEPKMAQFFQTKGEHTIQYFADISMQDIHTDKHLVIDVTSVSSLTNDTRDQLNMREGGYAMYEPGSAAELGTERKLKHYDSLFYLDQRLTVGEVELATISVETNGSMDKKSREVIRAVATMVADGKMGVGVGPPLKEQVDLEQRQIIQKIGVAFQVWRARLVQRSIKYTTLDDPPTNPYIPGSGTGRLRALPPPAFIGLPTNQRRTHAVAPRPPPRPPGLLGMRHDYWM